jgi:hypothetical protein
MSVFFFAPVFKTGSEKKTLTQTSPMKMGEGFCSEDDSHFAAGEHL